MTQEFHPWLFTQDKWKHIHKRRVQESSLSFFITAKKVAGRGGAGDAHHRRINKVWYIHTMEYYFLTKRNELLYTHHG